MSTCTTDEKSTPSPKAAVGIVTNARRLGSVSGAEVHEMPASDIADLPNMTLMELTTHLPQLGSSHCAAAFDVRLDADAIRRAANRAIAWCPPSSRSVDRRGQHQAPKSTLNPDEQPRRQVGGSHPQGLTSMPSAGGISQLANGRLAEAGTADSSLSHHTDSYEAC